MDSEGVCAFPCQISLRALWPYQAHSGKKWVASLKTMPHYRPYIFWLHPRRKTGFLHISVILLGVQWKRLSQANHALPRKKKEKKKKSQTTRFSLFFSWIINAYDERWQDNRAFRSDYQNKFSIRLEDKIQEMIAWSGKETRLWKQAKDLSVLGEPKSEDLNNQNAWVPGNLAKAGTDGLIHALPSLLSFPAQPWARQRPWQCPAWPEHLDWQDNFSLCMDW